MVSSVYEYLNMARVSFKMMASTFSWSHAPLNSIWWPVVAVSTYLMVVFFLCRHMNAREAPYQVPTWLAAGHNAVLSIGSAAMFVGCLSEVFNRWESDGSIEWFLCEVPSSAPTKGPLFFWSYIYYLSKYYELLDTVIGLLRGSRMPNFGLQVYHHVVVVFMAWAWCETAMSLQFGGLLFNTTVHVVMYGYYTCTVLKIRVAKVVKLGITQLQIVQFLTSGVLLASSLWVNSRKAGDGKSACLGYASDEFYVAWWNIAFNLTLLVSFAGVLNVNKKKPEAPARTKGE